LLCNYARPRCYACINCRLHLAQGQGKIWGGCCLCSWHCTSLWVLHSPYFARMPAMLRDDIRSAYAGVKPAGFNENPMQKIALIICGNEGGVHMVDAPKGFHAAIQQQYGAVIVQQGNSNNPKNNALPMGFQDRPLQDQMMVLYLQNTILGCKFSELWASVENNAVTNLRNYNVLNRNINRIAMA
jgi:hypothetical protein